MAFSLVQTVTDKTTTGGITSITEREGQQVSSISDKETPNINQWTDRGVSEFEDGQVIGLLLIFTYTF